MNLDEIDLTGQTPNYTRRRYNPCACDASRGIYQRGCECGYGDPDITHGGNHVEDWEHAQATFPRRT